MVEITLINPSRIVTQGDASMTNPERKRIFEEELDGDGMAMELWRNQREIKSLEERAQERR